MLRNFCRALLLISSLSLLAVLSSCGNTGSAPINGEGLGTVSVSIVPASMTIQTGTTQTFAATVNNSGVQTVQWQVNGLPGGAPIIGTIDSSGNYTAPQFVPNPASVVITAVANADNTVSGNANVSITGALLPATVYLSPTGTAYLGKGQQLNLSAGVTGPADTGVIWQVNGITNGNAAVGTIDPGSNGTAVYTAPAAVPNPSTVMIQAVSHAETNRLTTCSVVLSELPPSIATVTVTPVYAVNQSQTNTIFTASVINATDSSVSWEVNGSIGGDPPTYGTIASEASDTGVYTGPFTIPATGDIVSVTAVSNAQPSRASSATVAISPPPANGLQIEMGGGDKIETLSEEEITATVLATGLGTLTNTGVTWEVNGVPGGDSTYGTVVPVPGATGNVVKYFSPDVVPAQNTVVVEAISQQNSSVVGTLPIQVEQAPTSIMVVNAANQTAFNLGINQAEGLTATISGQSSVFALWYVCTSSQNCTLNGDPQYGTITPTTPSDSVTYTAPAAVPSPSTLIIKAVSQSDPALSGVVTVTIQQNPVITTEVTPSQPQSVEAGLSIDGFSAMVFGSDDQNITSWDVCTVVGPSTCYPNGNVNGNYPYGQLNPDSTYPTEEDYLAPSVIPNPSTVYIVAYPEAAPTVPSNAVPITIVPYQQQITITVNLMFPVILPTQADQVSAEVNGSSNQNVTWSLSLPASEGGGDCTGLPQTCGTVTPLQTDGLPATYMPPNPTPNNQDPWYVNITATAQVSPNPAQTVQVEITKNATASISISPNPPPSIQAGGGQDIPFTATIVNAPDQTITWELGCSSEAENGDWCGVGVFGNGDWTGCIEGSSGKQCKAGPLQEPSETDIVTYTPPPETGTQFQGNACVSQPGGPDEIPVSASIDPNGNNCTADSCTATVCIVVTPAGPK